MSLDRYKLWPVFFICFFFFMTLPIFLPKFRIDVFVSLFVIACYKLSLFECLSLVILVGFLYDLFAPQAHLGATSFIFALSLLLIYQQKKRFFKDNLSTFPIMSFYFSLTSSFFRIFFYERELFRQIDLNWIFSDFMPMCFADSVFGFAVFILPLILLKGRSKAGSEYFLRET